VIDHIVGLKPTKRGHVAILRVTERLILWTTLIAVKSTKNEATFKELSKLFGGGFGWPQILTGDGAFKEISRQTKPKGCEFVTVAPANSRSNWEVERPNREEKRRIVLTCQNAGEEWDEILPYLQIISRNSPMKRLGGLSPAELLCGQKLRPEYNSFIIDKVNAHNADDSINNQINIVRRIVDRRAGLDQLSEDIHEKNQISALAKKGASHTSEIEVDDLVLFRNSEINKQQMLAGNQAKNVYRVMNINRETNTARLANAYLEPVYVDGKPTVISREKINEWTGSRCYHLRKIQLTSLKRTACQEIYHIFETDRRIIYNNVDYRCIGFNMLTGRYVVENPECINTKQKRSKIRNFIELEPHDKRIKRVYTLDHEHCTRR
jgi:hypothetical protein